MPKDFDKCFTYRFQYKWLWHIGIHEGGILPPIGKRGRDDYLDLWLGRLCLSSIGRITVSAALHREDKGVEPNPIR